MKDVHEMLVQKEIELARVEKELEALRIVAPLLRDEEDWDSEAAEPTRTVTAMCPASAENGESVRPLR